MRWKRRVDAHERWRLQLHDYIADALDERERREFESHLQGCEECRATLDELRTVRTMLREMPEVEAPRSFRLTPQMVARGSAPVPIRPRQPAWIPRMAQIAAGIAIFGFVSVLAVDVFGSGGDGNDEAGVTFTAASASEEAAGVMSAEADMATDANAVPGSGETVQSAEAADDGQTGRTSGEELQAPPSESFDAISLREEPEDGDDKRLIRSLEAILASAAVGFIVLAVFARRAAKS